LMRMRLYHYKRTLIQRVELIVWLLLSSLANRPNALLYEAAAVFSVIPFKCY